MRFRSPVSGGWCSARLRDTATPSMVLATPRGVCRLRGLPAAGSPFSVGFPRSIATVVPTLTNSRSLLPVS